MVEYYLYIKAIHIISFAVWMAMLFYLPRLFVYHALNRNNANFVQVVEVQEFKLFFYIGCPGLIATLATGSALIMMSPGIFTTGGWLHAKLTIVVLLLLFHLYCGFLMWGLKRRTCTKGDRFFRFINELPTVALILIVIFAVVKPF